ncbi:hypothetical protein OPV22_017107 [Ensete ventricosum]|uniref:Uncharacterized protein n=1 Tax=Ensete ventricosum TaxID=4639 RepID=A0AAV8QRE2_ENSVE|nr:hypothetical protein OPV22_017107 [Ensete ventricosum]
MGFPTLSDCELKDRCTLPSSLRRTPSLPPFTFSSLFSRSHPSRASFLVWFRDSIGRRHRCKGWGQDGRSRRSPCRSRLR